MRANLHRVDAAREEKGDHVALGRRSISWRPSPTGLYTGLLFLAASLVPGLLPRPWQVQGVVSGLGLALGYAAGTVGAGLWRRWLGTIEPGIVVRAIAGGGVAVMLAWALVLHVLWRNDVAGLMDIDLPVLPHLALVLVLAALVAFVSIHLGRGIRVVLKWVRRQLRRWAPGWLAAGATVLLALAMVVLFFDLVVAGQLVPALEAAHRSSDQRFEPGVSPPTSEYVSGGPGSIIEWQTMGSQGRSFVAQAPSVAELEAYSGSAALEPIRIYAGLETARDAEARADIAVAEMERTAAFDREVIVLVAPTGSGWIDPYAVDGIEYMHNGDTAAVAIQYSYLASWMVMIGNQDLAVDATRSLLTAVTERLDREPEADRPRVLIYGESLGAFGWERLFDGLDDVTSTVDGALFVGPPRSGPLWQRLVANRDPGSPVWRPVYRGGETVRFGAGGDDLSAPVGEWMPPRVVYLQHASDPITWWTPTLMFDHPDWLRERGPDVSRHMPYIPVVTFWQVAVDLAVGTNAPIGHGHKFGAAQTEAWAAISAPPGWTPAATQRLISTLEE